MARKPGTILATIKPMAMARPGTAMSRIQDRPMSSRNAITTPPMHMIGAITTMVKPMTIRS